MLLASGISAKGVQNLFFGVAGGRILAVSLVDLPADSVRYMGYLFISRTVPSLGLRAQLEGRTMWLKVTALTAPTQGSATFTLGAVWKMDGLQWEVHDFT